ncbi:MAG: c-type cytochrome [Burkholderiaceae bacterium]|jgi:cytochrome c5|nr:c-type cytochrome [Burkholderiaceae bacterium]
MSDTTQKPVHDGSDQPACPTFWIGTGAFGVSVLLAIGMLFAATSVDRAATQASADAGIPQRLQKVGMVAIAAAPDPNRPLKSGEEVYKAQCSACHATGVSGSPKFGNAAEWGPRLGQGYDTLLGHALKGFNAMTPQGGAAFSDTEVGRALVYMANAAGGSLPEPPAPEPAASEPAK